ncbi:rhomboid family intramembrane serine protease [Lentibacter algarum]|uniref:rhomboid family intramembrane serine protease n=1 Tax=Lentibacter algarum TaxID=576131 RepID=UPI001C09961F|nr:rhomboid family intramembrane serine protease [Lentibacter algarum]MBU2983505.1 rhomboid family intramembrane serine protease [Lentibacter algarum]
MSEDSAVGKVAPVVIALFCVMVAVEGVFTLAEQGVIGGRLGIGWRLAAVQDYGLPGRLVPLMVERGEWPLAELSRFVTYPFLHGDFIGMVFGAVITLALGKFVGDSFHALAVVVIFFGASVAGGLVWGLVSGDQSYLIGALPGGYGLIGAFSFILWRRLKTMGESQIKAFQLIGMLLFIQLVLGVLFGAGTAWIAELAGFATGFGLSFLVSPGGFARLRARIRRA